MHFTEVVKDLYERIVRVPPWWELRHTFNYTVPRRQVMKLCTRTAGGAIRCSLLASLAYSQLQYCTVPPYLYGGTALLKTTSCDGNVATRTYCDMLPTLATQLLTNHNETALLKSFMKTQSKSCWVDAVLRGILLYCCSFALVISPVLATNVVDRKYKQHDVVEVFGNKAGPLNNPSETYPYYALPFCRQKGATKEDTSLREGVAGEHRVLTGYSLSFADDVQHMQLCTVDFSEEEVNLVVDALHEDYYVELMADGLPMWEYVGELVGEDMLFGEQAALVATAGSGGSCCIVPLPFFHTNALLCPFHRRCT